MTEPIIPRQFQAAAGAMDWRVLFGGAYAHFRTGSFAAGVALVTAIGELAGAANQPPPDVGLRSGGVTVRLITDEVIGLSECDAMLAAQISAAALELGAVADPSAVQVLYLAIDAMDIIAVRSFWRALLGYRDAKDHAVDLEDPRRAGPPMWFQQMDEPRRQRNRIHFDLSLPHDQAHTRVAAAVAAGGRVLSDERAPAYWVLADPEGNEACVATWMGRD
jgi:4a-hydroxytetrahydrobiopterin dehydratase